MNKTFGGLDWWDIMKMQSDAQNPSLGVTDNGPMYDYSGDVGDGLAGQAKPKQGFFGKLLSNPVGQSALLGFGGSLASGIAGLFRGKSQEKEARRRSLELYNAGIEGMKDPSDIINPLEMATRSWNAALPEVNERAKEVGANLDLDSGVAQGAIQEGMADDFMKMYASAYEKNAFGKADRKMNYWSGLNSRYGGFVG